MRDLIEFLIQKSRTYIYTTALPPAVAAATRAALRVSERESWRREKVLRAGASASSAGSAERRRRESRPGTDRRHHRSGDRRARRQRALAISKALEDKGFLVTAIRPPTVPAGTARLRVTLSAAHEEAQVDALVAALAEALAA